MPPKPRSRPVPANKVGNRCGRLPVILEHQAAQAPALRELRQIGGVDGSRHAVRIAVNMEVDYAVERLGPAGRGEK